MTNKSLAHLLLTFLVSLLGAGLAQAEQASASLLGSRVRIRLAQLAEPQVGVLTAAGSDSLAIETSASAFPLELRRADVLDLQVSRGAKRHTLQGLLAGTVAWGAIVGLIAAFDTLDESGVSEPLFIGVLPGVGAGVGTLVKTERWERVPLPAVSSRLGPPGPGLRLQVTLRF